MIYFGKDHPHRRGVEYVAKAVAKDKNKIPAAMRYLKSDGRRLFATDGHRLHLYESATPALPVGLYEVLEKNKKQLGVERVETDLDYPDIDWVFPTGQVTHVFPPKVISVGMKLAHVNRAIAIPAGLPPDQFADVVSDESIQSYLPGDGYSPVLFEGKEIKALIMPMRS